MLPSGWIFRICLFNNYAYLDLMDPGRAFDEFSLKHIFRSNSNRSKVTILFLVKRENTKEEDSFPENVIKARRIML